jgi:hypothetical protein
LVGFFFAIEKWTTEIKSVLAPHRAGEVIQRGKPVGIERMDRHDPFRLQPQPLNILEELSGKFTVLETWPVGCPLCAKSGHLPAERRWYF